MTTLTEPCLFDVLPFLDAPPAPPVLPPVEYDSDYLDVDLFAGPGGWDQGVKPLGIAPRGFEWGDAQCATARAAGHERVQADIATLDPVAATDRRRVRGLIASPPCQGFSRLGKGKGREDSELLLHTIPDLTPHNIDARLADLRAHMKDGRSLLALEPLRWTMATNPAWLAWEQVPAVLVIWEAVALVLTRMGYSVATDIINAEQFGVPQTRKRAVLVARNDGREARLPTPTHSKYHSRTPARLDPGVKPWVTMAAALGWGEDPETVRAAVEPRVNNQSGTAFDLSWPLTRPSLAVAGRDLVMMPGANANRYNGSTKSRNDGVHVTAAEAGVLQTFPADYPWQGTKAEKHQQSGDAVPPQLALHIVKTITEGMDLGAPAARAGAVAGAR